eukprot:4677103-Pyramimonas_sp.AAC.1
MEPSRGMIAAAVAAAAALLEFLGGPLGTLLVTLEGHRLQDDGGPQLSSPLMSPQTASWGSLGAFVGALGAIWSILGAILSQPGLSEPYWRSSWRSSWVL